MSSVGCRKDCVCVFACLPLARQAEWRNGREEKRREQKNETMTPLQPASVPFFGHWGRNGHQTGYNVLVSRSPIMMCDVVMEEGGAMTVCLVKSWTQAYFPTIVLTSRCDP
jgi:hypothetical protein